MAKRSSAKRDKVKSRTATLYAKRDTRGKFKEMDEQGRSQATDRPRKAKKRVSSGYGDQGDRGKTGTAKRSTARSRRGGSARAKSR